MKAIQEPNVRVHFTAAKYLTENGIVGEDGVEREVDTVICATGKQASPNIGPRKAKVNTYCFTRV